MISKVNAKVILIIQKDKLLKDIDIKKYSEQYDNLKVIYNSDFHDRYIIIDKAIIYHLGTSLNHAGKKIFGINKLEDKDVQNTLLTKIKNLI